jgi:hypothetical protein
MPLQEHKTACKAARGAASTAPAAAASAAGAAGPASSAAAAADFASWPVRQLKEHLHARGVDATGCIEKIQLVELCQQHP